MVGAGLHVFSVWPYCIAHVRPPGIVEVNPKLVAAIIGTTSDKVQEALDFLCQPDPDSRSRAEDGRRLVREGQFLYRMVNFQEYRNRIAAESKKQADRERIALKRSECRNLSQDVANVAQAEAEAEAEDTHIEPPKGFPKTEKDAIEIGALAGADKETCRVAYNFAVSRGYTDAHGQPIRSWRHFVKANAAMNSERKERDKYAANSRPSIEKRTDGNFGTLNDGKASQYRGVGKLV